MLLSLGATSKLCQGGWQGHGHDIFKLSTCRLPRQDLKAGLTTVSTGTKEGKPGAKLATFITFHSQKERLA